MGRRLNGVSQVEDTEKYFKTTLKAGGIMDVVEQYPWTGETVEHGRRDKRKGTHRGSLRRTPEGPQLQWAQLLPLLYFR